MIGPRWLAVGVALLLVAAASAAPGVLRVPVKRQPIVRSVTPSPPSPARYLRADPELLAEYRSAVSAANGGEEPAETLENFMDAQVRSTLFPYRPLGPLHRPPRYARGGLKSKILGAQYCRECGSFLVTCVLGHQLPSFCTCLLCFLSMCLLSSITSTLCLTSPLGADLTIRQSFRRPLFHFLLFPLLEVAIALSLFRTADLPELQEGSPFGHLFCFAFSPL